MSRLDPIRTLCFPALFGVLLASGAQAQERAVVANQVRVSGDEATLHLEFSDGEALDVSFAGGTATVDGETLGQYEVDGTADQAWRSLLANVLSLSDGALAEALVEWQPDSDAESPETSLLESLDDALDNAVAAAATTQRPDGEQVEVGNGENLGRLLRLLSRGEYGRGLSEALESTDLDRVQMWIGEDHVIGPDETIDGTVLVVEGEVEVQGRVRGDVIVVGGSLELDDGATVDGDIRLIESRMSGDDGEVRGDVVDVTRELRSDRSRLRDEIRRELEQELGDDFRFRSDHSPGFSGRVARAVGGVLESVLTFALLGVLALVITHFAGDRVDAVVRAVGENPTRSAAVGFAGTFLVLPVYVLGLVVLTVSIVGIPALMIWAPLFPLAVALGVFLGYMSVGQYVGQWVLDREFTWLDWVDRDNEGYVRLVGLAALLAPFAAASLLRAVPIVGWMGGIVSAVSCLAAAAAIVTGFGAVLITRGGRTSTYGFGVNTDLGDWSSDPAVPDDDFEDLRDVTTDPLDGEDA